MSPLFLLLTLVAVSAAALVASQRRAARRSSSSWEDLVARLQAVPTAAITAIAYEHLNPAKGQLRAEPDELWQQIGGVDGVDRMRANAEVLLALASYTERWNCVESRIVVERMRRDGVALRRAAWRLLITAWFGSGRARNAFSIHEAASAYFLMQQRLLALYETSHAGRLAHLAAAL